MQNANCWLKFTRRRSSLDVRATLLGSWPDLPQFCRGSPISTSKRWPLSSQRPEMSDWTGDNELKVLESRCFGVFVLVYLSKAISLLVCPTSHPYVDCSMIMNRPFPRLLQMEEVKIFQIPFFIGRAYFQHEGCG